MFGFPINSQGDIQKFTNDADSGFPKIQQREVFYSIKSGNWTDTTIWQTASGKVGKLPSPNDAVYIRYGHTIVYNVLDFSTASLSQDSGGALPNVVSQINSLYVSGTLSWGGNNWYRLVVLNKLRVATTGIIDMSPSNASGNSASFWICGTDNEFLGTFIPATSGQAFVAYWGGQNKTILSRINYNDLRLYGYEPSNSSRITQSVISLNSDLTINGNLNISPSQTPTIFDTSIYNLSVNGTTTIGHNGTIRASGNGNLLFIGQFVQNITNPAIGINLEFTGNPNVEFRNGFSVTNTNVGFVGTTGTGTWSFTTNNQSLAISTNQTFDCKIVIGSGVTLTRTNTGTGFAMNLNDTINGVDSTSKLLMGINSPIINFLTQNSAENSMSTGIVDFTTNVNTIGYTGNYSATIPSRFPIFHNLTISGTGTKTFGVNTTLNGSLTTTGTIDFSSYNVTVNGTTMISNNPGKIMKSGAGNILFVGLVTIGNTGNAGGALDLTTGNPDVEFRNGITGDYSNGVTFKTGTGTWKFTTNNQSLSRFSNGGNWIYDCAISIENITLTIPVNTGVNIINSTINGTTGTSKLLHAGTLYFNTTSLPMATGVFDYTTNANTIGYVMTTSQTIPYSTYSSLVINGIGVKTLSQNTIVSGNLTIGGSTLEMSIYDIDVYGTTSSDYSTIQKSSSGNITFRGLLNITGPSPNILVLSGNPNVEFRGGITLPYNSTWNTGTGTWSFTTNNQTVQINGIQTGYTFSCPIVVSNINLTLNSNQRTFTFNSTINGTTSTSSLIIAATSTIQYNSATKPMATGILDTSTNLNTWIYGNANQDILGGPSTAAKQVYRNLTLNGGGTKTLQGYVSVLNTYTLTAPATLNNNGFTLTNP